MIFFQYLDIAVELLPSVLVALGLALAYLILIYALIRYVEESGDLRTRLYQLEAEYDDLKAQFPQKRRRIAQLKKALPALRRDYKALCDYYALLRETEIEAEREVIFREEASDKEIVVRENYVLLK